MSTNVFGSKRSAPGSSNELANSGSQPTRKKRSLSDRLRNIFSRDSSKSRTKSSDRRQRNETTTIAESPRLRPPNVNFSIGKKSPEKKKNKENVPPLQISAPIEYQYENRSGIYGENFVPRTPQISRENNERTENSSIYVTRTGGTTTFREDQTQQVNSSDSGDAFRVPSYISDRSRSPSMNYRPSSNPEPEYYFYNERSPPSASGPLSDVEVISTPQRQRRFQETTNSNPYLTTKPPAPPQNTSRPSSIVQSTPMTNSAIAKNSSSSTAAETRSITSSTRDTDIPKLAPPTIGFGSTSSKKKDKSNKSKARSTETATIGHLIEQNPLTGNRAWTNTYGSLADVEPIYDPQPRPIRTSNNKYPYISAIVEHHLRPTTTRYPGTSVTVPHTTTTTSTATGSSSRPARFDTSTATLNDQERNPYGTGQTTTNVHQDGYSRPMTPDRDVNGSDIRIIRVGLNLSAGQSHNPPPRPTNPSDSPTTYRSSTTIYTRDKNDSLDRGEIRTWTLPQPEKTSQGYTTNKPNIEVEIDRRRDRYEEQIVPPKIIYRPEEFRYSPRLNEEKVREIIDNEEEEIQEERYEVSYEYERQIDEYSYGTQQIHDEINSNHRFQTSQTATERDPIYHQSPRSFTETQYTQESSNRVTPVDHSKDLHTYTLRRDEDYNGLGIMIATDAQTRSYHFIRDVESGSPADRAGLRKNDRLVSVNGTNVENMDFSHVLILIKQGLDNERLQLSVIHELDSI